jgi:oligopeptide/dipeptide ABC transporter ATP-binding protein
MFRLYPEMILYNTHNCMMVSFIVLILTVVILFYNIYVLHYLRNRMLMQMDEMVSTDVSVKKRELFKNPMHPYTRGLLASIPSLSKSVDRLYTIEGVVPSLKKMPKGCRFCDRCPSAMTRCREENPELIHREGRMIRCFLYDDTNREESN